MADERSPHDPFSIQQFSQLQKARALFEAYLPAEAVRRIRWEALKLGQLRYVDEQLRSLLPDLVFEGEWDTGEPLRFYILFEHKSWVDAQTLLQLLKALARIYDDWTRRRKEAGESQMPLPFVFPFVLYHGESGWTVSKQFADLVFIPEDLKGVLRRLTIAFEHLLVDLGQTAMEQIRGSMELRLILGLLKGVSQGREQEWFEKVFRPVTQILSQPDTSGFLRELFEYLLRASGTVDFSTFREMVDRITDERSKANVMTLAEKIFAEGRDQGWSKGRDEGWSKGREEGWQSARQAAILDVLQARFADVSEEVRQKIASLRTEASLSRALRSASVVRSLPEFIAILT